MFHYTTNDGALGIIGSGQIFATHYKYLNDSLELKIAESLISPLLEQGFKSAYDELSAAGELKGFAEDNNIDIFQQQAEFLIRKSFDAGDYLSPVFLASFCEHDPGSLQWDHGLLSQWRGYGSQGGCALEFDVDLFQEKLNAEEKAHPYSPIAIGNVIYDDHSTCIDEVKIQDIAKLFVRRLRAKSHGIDISDLPGLDDLHDALFLIGPKLKHKSFMEEKEVRIIAAPALNPRGKKIYDKPEKKIEYRMKNGVPVPYIKLFDHGGELPIVRIIVGPQREQSNVVQALRLILRSRKTEIEVVASAISFIP
ncbi:DUF2971 domain-containing protein [Methylobacterium sp. Leaf102]|uniref:DUF2971 domain-containing protein n=1 Tax=Methylobacterium sp. Leaf102 TaxID=1736253 RepID=UPI0009EBE176|nr:DUF2971 domain-containing protein [Methylobacterium sp. Leaf102]